MMLSHTSSKILLPILSLLVSLSQAAFLHERSSVTALKPSFRWENSANTKQKRTTKSLSALLAFPDIASSLSFFTDALPPSSLLNPSIMLATIDADVAKIPENEFRTVFTGGIVVMMGGIVSALIVGFILESRDLYATVVADSYAQGAEDEEFWKGLSDEETKKAQELLQKLKASKGEDSSLPPVATGGEATEAKTLKRAETAQTPEKEKDAKEIGMFSDYGD